MYVCVCFHNARALYGVFWLTGYPAGYNRGFRFLCRVAIKRVYLCTHIYIYISREIAGFLFDEKCQASSVCPRLAQPLPYIISFHRRGATSLRVFCFGATTMKSFYKCLLPFPLLYI